MSVKGLGRGGFTLLELMIVITVIGILATIAIPKISGMIRIAQDGSTRGNLGSIRSALRVYSADTEGLNPVNLLPLTAGAKYITRIPEATLSPYHPRSLAVSVGGGATAVTDAGGWAYSNDPAQTEYGQLWVNCTHTDTKGSVWTTY